MILHLSKSKSLHDVQTEFTSYFPYLRIGFFNKRHKAFQGSDRAALLKPEAKLPLTGERDNLEVEIDETMTVKALEEMFKKQLNLNIQVFRKSGRAWLETTVTDNWTLRKQNEEGKELSDLSF